MSVVEMGKLGYNWIDLPGKVSLISVPVHLRGLRSVKGQLSALNFVCNHYACCFLTYGEVDP